MYGGGSGVSVEISGDSGEAPVGAGYGPCWWLRQKYEATGYTYWLNRYRVCRWGHE